MPVKPKALLSWSSGKDSAWALQVLRERGEVEVVGLVTTFNEAFDRVAMHSVRRTLVEAQATAANVPLWSVWLPWPCTNAAYEEKMLELVARAKDSGVTHFAFGDLYLEDIRDYRVRQLAGSDIEPMFPIWTTRTETKQLARSMIDSGLRATLTCVDPKQLATEFAGQEFDRELLENLPPGVDPCGEQGEFHTFCYSGPMFDRPILTTVGKIVYRDGFCFADIEEAG